MNKFWQSTNSCQKNSSLFRSSYQEVSFLREIPNVIGLRLEELENQYIACELILIKNGNLFHLFLSYFDKIQQFIVIYLVRTNIIEK